jgi:hypothetical protein
VKWPCPHEPPRDTAHRREARCSRSAPMIEQTKERMSEQSCILVEVYVLYIPVLNNPLYNSGILRKVVAVADIHVLK